MTDERPWVLVVPPGTDSDEVMVEGLLAWLPGDRGVLLLPWVFWNTGMPHIMEALDRGATLEQVQQALHQAFENMLPGQR